MATGRERSPHQKCWIHRICSGGKENPHNCQIWRMCIRFETLWSCTGVWKSRYVKSRKHQDRPFWRTGGRDLDHFANSGFMSLEGRPNSWFHEVPIREEKGRRSRPLDPSHRRTVGLEPPHGIMYRGFGVERIYFRLQKL
jgi:hypothetical protein